MKRNAFTLMELMIVIVIIGILSAVGMVMFGDQAEKAKTNVVKHNFNEIVKFIKLSYLNCEIGEPVMMNNQGGVSQDVTNGFCNNSPLGACYTLIAHFKSLKWKNPYTDYYIKNNVDSEYVLHCSNAGYPSTQLVQRAGYIFITNVSGAPKTMRLEMRWDNDYSGNWSKRYSRKDITTP
tara:strand:+ start:417 stop:953 length:537 start_codon:yes stop_codon:yes gene_type:complete